MIKSLAYMSTREVPSQNDVKRKALPHQALAVGLHNRSWGTRWLETRKWLELERLPILMTAISHRTGEFIDRRMTSSEGVDHLQELLVFCGVPEDTALYTTHSSKRTILDWATFSKLFTHEERQCLGHHIGNKKSMLAYSVEEMTRLPGKVHRMLYSIREGLFDPNLTGAARIHQDNADLRGGDVVERNTETVVDFGDDSSSSEESDVRSVEQEMHTELPVAAQRDEVEDLPLERSEALPEGLKSDCVRQALSGILHVKAVDYKLLCGRPHTHNYVDCDMSGKGLTRESICKQCSEVALHDS